MITWRILRVFIVLVCVVFRLSCSVAVSDVDCTNGGTECNGIANSACDTASGVMKCKCNTDFDEDLTDRSTCVKVVTATDCTGTAACPDIDNSLCSSDTCTCVDGYTEKVDTCMKVLGSPCTGTAACPDATNSICSSDTCTCKNDYQEKENVCKLIVTATVCTGTAACPDIDNSLCISGKCTCVDGFTGKVDTCMKVLGSPCTGDDPCPGATNSVCSSDTCTCTTDYGEKENVCTLTVSGTTCSAGGGGCEDIENAICDAEDGKCTCSPSFMMNVDTCEPGNAAVSVEVRTIAMVLSAFVAIHGMLRLV